MVNVIWSPCCDIRLRRKIWFNVLWSPCCDIRLIGKIWSNVLWSPCFDILPFYSWPEKKDEE